MRSPDDLLDVARGVVDRATGNEQIEAYVARSRSTDIRAYQGEVESLASSESMGVGVRVIVDGRQGFAYAGTFDADAVTEALDAARDNARFASVDPHTSLAVPDGVSAAQMALDDPDLAAVPTSAKIELALDLEARLSALDPRVSGVEAADYNDVMAAAALASTAGIEVVSVASRTALSADVLASDGSGETQTGFGWSVGRGFGDLDPHEAASSAVERATRMLGATKPRTERTTVVLDPMVTAMFLSIIGGTLSGESVAKGRSLFAGRLGDAVAHPSISLIDDPTDPLAFTANLYDGEGLASRRNPLISDGRLEAFVHNATSAARLGTTSTASAVRGGHASTPGVGCRALGLVPGDLSRDELYQLVGDGIVISSVAGLHSGVNPVSGDFSTGAEGVRLRDGVVCEPIREFTIGSTLQRMLLDIVGVGADLERLPMSASGVSLAVSDVTISGS